MAPRVTGATEAVAMGGDSACFSLQPVKTRHGSAMQSAPLRTIERDRIDMVKAPIAVQEDVWGLQTLRGAQTCQRRRSDYLLEGNCLVGREECRWRAEREETRMNRSLPARIVNCDLSHPGGHDESQAKHQSDHDDRRIRDRSLMIRGGGKKLVYDLCGCRPFLMCEGFFRRIEFREAAR